MGQLRVIAIAIAVFLAVGLPLGTTPALAQQVINKPVYSPHTKSYFELVKMNPNAPIRSGAGVIEWQEAKALAERRTHKGVRGRLAVITDAETNAFLRTTFRPEEEAWIGLRYWCAFGKLQWVTGDEHPLTAYANWDIIWNRNAVHRNEGNSQNVCPREVRGAYLGVHYWAVNEGFYWNAHAAPKKFPLFFVEYPTGTE